VTRVTSPSRDPSNHTAVHLINHHHYLLTSQLSALIILFPLIVDNLENSCFRYYKMKHVALPIAFLQVHVLAIFSLSCVGAFSPHCHGHATSFSTHNDNHHDWPPMRKNGRMVSLLFSMPESQSQSQSQSRAEDEGERLPDFTRRSVPIGKPSSPGWKNKEQSLDELTEWAIADEANRPILCEWEPDALWLWTKWRGTALSITYIPILINIALGIGVDRFVHWNSESTWALFAVPPESDPLIQQLVAMKGLWECQLTLCTFILAFFTSQAYAHWQSVYFTTRKIQGRINDVCMLLTISAKRSSVTNTVNRKDKITTGYDKEARELVETCTRLMRLSHTFFWASTPTISNGVGDAAVLDGDHNSDLPKSERANDAIGPLLLSPMGLQGLVEANELTREEMKALLYSGLPPSQYPYVLLEWVGLYTIEGLRDGTLDGGYGVENQLMSRLTDVRAEYFSIGDLAGTCINKYCVVSWVVERIMNKNEQ
jgi:hypothetical protein